MIRRILLRTAQDVRKRGHLATARGRVELRKRTSCGLERVLSDTKGLKIALFDEARQLDYHVGVIVIGLDDAQLSVARVMDRVEHGGQSAGPIVATTTSSAPPRSLDPKGFLERSLLKGVDAHLYVVRGDTVPPGFARVRSCSPQRAAFRQQRASP